MSLSFRFVLPLMAALFATTAERPPNVVIIFTDDQGYGDIGCFGAKGFTTPNLDRLAEHGTRFTNFHVAQAVCSASRIALLTGCYPNRVGFSGALMPNSKIGIHADELTIGEMLKARGYATAAVGKWHLGDKPQFLPTNNGFDSWYGLPYSNDMWPNHPTAKFPPLPLMEGEKVLALNPDQTTLTTDYTTHAVRFIEQNKDKPFFLYLAHSMPHVPLFVSDKFKGKTELGLYGDVISEIDWSVGQVMDILDKHHLRDNTLIIYTSDNGPWLSYGDHAGSTSGLKEGKGTSWEGGVRVPCLMRWPNHIPAGRTCDEALMTIDVMPTLAHITGSTLPNHLIDGKNVWPILSHADGATNPHDGYAIYYNKNDLQAVISGQWKLVLPHPYRSLNGRPGGSAGQPVAYEMVNATLALYNISSDKNETTNVAAANPEVVANMQKLAERFRAELGDNLTKREPTQVRPAGNAE